MFKHIVWDFDGTLFDSYPMSTRSMVEALKELKVYEEYQCVMSKLRVSGPHALEFFSKKHNLDIEILREEYNMARKKKSMDEVKPFEHAYDICMGIKNGGMRNYIYTNRGKSAVGYIEHHNMGDLFKEYITKESNFPRKPSPEALIDLVSRLELNKEEVLMVGDREMDLLAAKRAGIRGCYFDILGENLVEDFYYRIESLNELFELLKIEKI